MFLQHIYSMNKLGSTIVSESIFPEDFCGSLSNGQNLLRCGKKMNLLTTWTLMQVQGSNNIRLWGTPRATQNYITGIPLVIFQLKIEVSQWTPCPNGPQSPLQTSTTGLKPYQDFKLSPRTKKYRAKQALPP
jgi:hypothetical protein